jgi:sec-independent protein translocase protein TatA
MFTGWERPSHWLVLAILVVVLFGYKKLPDAARSVGRSLRIFKTEIKGMSEDDAARAATKAEAAAPPAPAAPPAVAPTVAPAVPPAQPVTPAEPGTAPPPSADTELPATASAKNDTATGGE